MSYRSKFRSEKPEIKWISYNGTRYPVGISVREAKDFESKAIEIAGKFIQEYNVEKTGRLLFFKPSKRENYEAGATSPDGKTIRLAYTKNNRSLIDTVTHEYTHRMLGNHFEKVSPVLKSKLISLYDKYRKTHKDYGSTNVYEFTSVAMGRVKSGSYCSKEEKDAVQLIDRTYKR